MNTHTIGKTDILLSSMICAGVSDSPILVWIDTARDQLCFGDRRVRLADLDHDERAMLRRISMLRDYAPTSEFFDTCDRELGPLISKLWRLTTN